MPNPEIVVLELGPQHPFFVLASDGVFEFLSSQTVVDMVIFLFLLCFKKSDAAKTKALQFLISYTIAFTYSAYKSLGCKI